MKRLILRPKMLKSKEQMKKDFVQLYGSMNQNLVIVPNDYEVIFEPSEWITFDVAKPNVYQDIIVCDKDGMIYLAAANNLDQLVERTGEKIHDAIAWMPAPKPYEVK